MFVCLLIKINGNCPHSYLPGTVANPIMSLFHTHRLLYDGLTWNVTGVEYTDDCHQFYSKCTVRRSENSDTVISVCYFNVVADVWKTDLPSHSPQYYWLGWVGKHFVLDVLGSSQSSTNKCSVCVKIIYIFTYNPSKLLNVSIFLRSSSGNFFTSIKQL